LRLLPTLSPVLEARRGNAASRLSISKLFVRSILLVYHGIWSHQMNLENLETDLRHEGADATLTDPSASTPDYQCSSKSMIARTPRCCVKVNTGTENQKKSCADSSRIMVISIAAKLCEVSGSS